MNHDHLRLAIQYLRAIQTMSEAAETRATLQQGRALAGGIGALAQMVEDLLMPEMVKILEPEKTA